MAKIFTLTVDEPVVVPTSSADNRTVLPDGSDHQDLDRWVVLPAGAALAVAESQRVWHRLTEDGSFVPVEPFTENVDVIVYADGTVEGLPVEVGILGEGEPDDLSGLPLLTAEEATRLHPEFADVFAEIDPDPEDEELDRAEAERDKQWEAMCDVEDREGRLSAAYRAQLQLTPFAVEVETLAEMAELYNDNVLRQAVRQHPDMGTYEWSDAEAKRVAALGLLSRMLVAEAILQPGVRQSDLKKVIGVGSGAQTERTYPMGKAGFLKRTSEKTQVFLSPGDRCGELGLDADSAAELVAWRGENPEGWAEIIQRATHVVERRREPESDDDYQDEEEVLGGNVDDGSIPFGPDAPSARAWPRVPDTYADNPYILKWWTSACDEAVADLIRRWRWHYPWNLTEAVTAAVGKETIDRWAAEDPKCQQYAYYNVLMYFGIAHARRIGLERALPMPQARTCLRCGKHFDEDRVPMHKAKADNPAEADYCSKC